MKNHINKVGKVFLIWFLIRGDSAIFFRIPYNFTTLKCEDTP